MYKSCQICADTRQGPRMSGRGVLATGQLRVRSGFWSYPATTFSSRNCVTSKKKPDQKSITAALKAYLGMSGRSFSINEKEGGKRWEVGQLETFQDFALNVD